MTYGAQSYKNIATRIVNAHVDFAETLVGIAGITMVDAEKVTKVYLKNKIAKVDATIGRISVKHGAFLDADVIRRALASVA